MEEMEVGVEWRREMWGLYVFAGVRPITSPASPGPVDMCYFAAKIPNWSGPVG